MSSTAIGRNAAGVAHASACCGELQFAVPRAEARGGTLKSLLKKSPRRLGQDKLKLIPHGKPMAYSPTWAMLQLAPGTFDGDGTLE